MKKISQNITLIFHAPFDVSTEEGRDKERKRRIALTAITAAIAKVLAMATPLLTVRITLGYMGEETYGLWSTVTSFFAMFAFADLGLGSGLQTELSRASAKDDKKLCDQLISSTYIILLIVSVILLLLFILLYPIIDWASLINAKSQLSISLAANVVMAIVVSKVLNIPFSLITRTQMALQEGYKTNLWQCGANVLSVVFVLLVSKLDLGILVMIWSSSMITVIIAVLNTFVYFNIEKPHLKPRLKYFNKDITVRLLKTGIAFFVLSIFTSVSLSIDNFIVARTCSLSEVTPYSIIYKIAYMISVVSTMLSSPMWAANGEAIARGEFNWVKGATKKITLLSLLFSSAASVLIIIFIQIGVDILSGGGINVQYGIVVGMCFMQILVSITNPFFMILNAAKLIKIQILIYALYAVIGFTLKYILAIKFGAIAIVWSGAILYLVLITIPTIFTANVYLSSKIKRGRKRKEYIE